MFIQEGIVELDYPIGNTLYYVQQGFKRKVNQDPHYGFLDLLRNTLLVSSGLSCRLRNFLCRS